MPFKASSSVYVEVVCDACGRRYGFARKVECQADNEARAIIKLRKKMAQLYRHELHWNDEPPFYIDCPQCGFVPAWMVRSARKQNLISIAGLTCFVSVLIIGFAGYALNKLTEKNVLKGNMAWEIMGAVTVGVVVIGAILHFLWTRRVKHPDWPLAEWLLRNNRPTTITLPRINPG